MAKLYDITDKLTFDTNPVIVVKGKEIEVDSSATAVLIIMNLSEQLDEDPAKVLEMMDVIFTEEGRETIKELKLSFKDLNTLISVAMSLAIGEDPDEDEGE